MSVSFLWQEEDVLLKRKLWVMFAVSMVIHFTLLGGVTFASNRGPIMKPREPVISVNLMAKPKEIKPPLGRPDGVPGGVKTNKQSPKEQPKEQPQPKEEKLKPEQTKSATIPPPPKQTEKKGDRNKTRSGTKEAKKTEARKSADAKRVLPEDATKHEVTKSEGSQGSDDEDMTSVNSAIDNLRKKENTRDSAVEQARWKAALGDIRGSVQSMSYWDLVAYVYAQAMTVPASLRQAKGLEVKVFVKVDKEGNVMDYNIVSKSSSSEFNFVVEKALKTVKKVDPVPFEVKDEGFEIPLLFLPN